MSVEVFFSYSEQDEQLRDELETHLSILKRQGAIATWHRRQISAGTEWQGEIDAHLDSAQMILLLVSPDFLASDYIWDVELRRAMERHATGLARVIPVLLRPVDNWQKAPFGELQPLPTNGMPVTTWENRDRAFENIAAGIRKILESFSSEKTSLEVGEKVREKRQIGEKPANLLSRFSDFFSEISTIWIISLRAMIVPSLVVTGLVMGGRWLGWLQRYELMVFDQLMQQRPSEEPDPRLLIITVDDKDIQYQDRMGMKRQGSLADRALAQLLEKLKPHNPAVIGLDIYREPSLVVDPEYAEKATSLRGENFIDVCKIGDKNSSGVSPPHGIPKKNLGFTDLVKDEDRVLRRQLFGMTPDDRCKTSQSFSFRIAHRYLTAKGIEFKRRKEKKEFQIGNRVFQELETHSAGYHNIEAKGSQVLLNYRSSEQIATKVALRQILKDSNDSELSKLVENRIVLIGTIEKSYKDYHLTPYSKKAGQSLKEIPGVEVQAHTIGQLVSAALDNRAVLWWLPQWGDFLVVWGWSFTAGVLVWCFRSRRLYRLIMVGGIVLIIWSVACYQLCLMFLRDDGLWLPLIPSVLTLVITEGVVVVLDSASQINQKQ